MTAWLHHPAYAGARDRLIAYLRSDRYRFRRLEPVIFLCGGAHSAARDTLRDYLRKTFPFMRMFYAERVWEHIASRSDRGALKMEADLAELADLLIIIVESPGTFAELGAFSLSDPLREKLLPIVAEAYQGEESFIATGPLRWIDAESKFKPTIYAPLLRILEIADEIDERISRIPKSRPAKVSDLAESPKHLLFFLCDLVSVIYPATIEMIEHYVGSVAPSILSSDIDVPTLIGLGVAMDLLVRRTMNIAGDDIAFYIPAGTATIERPYHHKKLLDLPTQRASHVSVLLTVPEAKAALDNLAKVS